MNVGAAIYAILTDASAVTDIVVERVYPGFVAQEIVLPGVVYRVESTEPSPTHSGPSDVDGFFVDVDCLATTYAGANTLARAVRTALDGYEGTAGGVNVDGTRFDDYSDAVENDKEVFVATLTFKIRVKY